MKVAVCLSGQPRFFSQTFPYLKKNILDKFDCDVFLHAWHNPENTGSCYSGASWTNGLTDTIKKDTDLMLLDLYQPKSYKIEPQYENFPTPRPIEEYTHNIAGGTSANVIFSMIYSMCESLKLREQYEIENQIEYDVVIRLRYDFVVWKNIDLNLDFDGGIYYTMSTKSVYPEKLCDWFNFGSSENMTKYSTAFDNMDSYYWDSGVEMAGESILMHHLETNGVKYIGLYEEGFLARDEDLSNRRWGEGN